MGLVIGTIRQRAFSSILIDHDCSRKTDPRKFHGARDYGCHQKPVERQNLTGGEARSAMQDLMSGQASEAQSRRIPDSSSDERRNSSRAGCVCQRDAGTTEPFWDAVCRPCWTPAAEAMLGTFNISTATALVAAGAGSVAKHGTVRQPVSAQCRYWKLGIDIQMPTERLRQAVTEVGFGFLFAQRFYFDEARHADPHTTESANRFNILRPPQRGRVSGTGSRVADVRRLPRHWRANGAGLRGQHDGVDEISSARPRKSSNSDTAHCDIQQSSQDFGPIAPGEAAG
jgi:hypothetical protein